MKNLKSYILKKIGRPLYTETIKKSFDSWISYQTYYEETPIEKIEESRKRYCIWNNYSTADSWIDHEVKRIQEDKIRYEAHQAYNHLTWYEKEFLNFPILASQHVLKDAIVDSFIYDEEGKEICSTLSDNMDLKLTDLLDPLKHFSKSIGIPQNNIDEKINAFINRNRDRYSDWLIGINGDGGRVFRTIIIVCIGLYVEQYNEIQGMFKNRN